MSELFTVEDIKELEEELEHLKVVGRPEMADKIRVAREFGDLSENAEYDIAKEEQAKMESRIAEIEQKLRNAVIYERTKTDKVSVGHKIKLLDEDTNLEIEFELVGSHQANPMENKISNMSPVGKELIGRKKGESFTIKVRGDKVKRYKIIKIF